MVGDVLAGAVIYALLMVAAVGLVAILSNVVKR